MDLDSKPIRYLLGGVKIVEGILKVKVEEKEDHFLITLCGEIDLYTKNILEEVLKKYTLNKNLIFDFEKVTYMDSSGISVLLLLKKNLDDERTIRIINVGKNILKIFEIIGLNRFFHCKSK